MTNVDPCCSHRPQCEKIHKQLMHHTLHISLWSYVPHCELEVNFSLPNINFRTRRAKYTVHNITHIMVRWSRIFHIEKHNNYAQVLSMAGKQW